MRGLNTKIAAIAGLLLIATALALQFSKTSAPPRESARSSESPNLPATSAASPQTVPAREVSVSSIASQTERKLAGSAEEIIAKIKNALEPSEADRKSTRLNSSHLGISYAVFCLK